MAADGRVDGTMPDGSPDAAVKTRSATLAVTEVKVTDPGADVPAALGGASISLVFSDVSQGGGQVIYGNGAVGSCTVIKYDGAAGSSGMYVPNPSVDEGPVTIGGAGVQKPTGQCAFLGDGNYHCITDMQTGKDGTYTVMDNGAAGELLYLTVTGTTFDTDPVGQYMTLSGFTDTALNKTWPVVNETVGTLVLALNPGTTAGTTGDTAFTGVGWTMLQGEAPVPGGAATVQFFDDGTGAVSVDLAANTEYDAISVSTHAEGGAGTDSDGDHPNGLVLNGPNANCTDCAQPTAFPLTLTTDQTVTFSCDPPRVMRSTLRRSVTAGRTTPPGTAWWSPAPRPRPILQGIPRS